MLNRMLPTGASGCEFCDFMGVYYKGVDAHGSVKWMDNRRLLPLDHLFRHDVAQFGSVCDVKPPTQKSHDYFLKAAADSAACKLPVENKNHPVKKNGSYGHTAWEQMPELDLGRAVINDEQHVTCYPRHRKRYLPDPCRKVDPGGSRYSIKH
jgi:hypothetical protein